MKKLLKPIHPGEILREEFMRPNRITANALALELHVPAPTVYDIVKEKRSISPGMALRLGQFFGTSSEFWANLQARYSLEVERDRELGRVQRQITPLAIAAGPAPAHAYYLTMNRSIKSRRRSGRVPHKGTMAPRKPMQTT